MAITLRAVSEHDAEEIARLDQRLSGQWRPEHWEERIAFSARRDPEGSWVALEDEQLVGYLFAEVRGHDYGFAENTGWLEVLGVDPDRAGSNIGTGLVEMMLAHFERQQIPSVRTLISAEQDGVGSFLQHLGFEIEPVRVLRKKLGTK